MVLSFFILLAFYAPLAMGIEIKKHVQNSVYPYDLDPPSYNIESWVKQLHLQQCALVEVGDKYYAIFVESRPRRYDHEKGIKEYFLGLCDDDTLNKWSFCAASLQRKRADDCNFYTKNMYNTRVHRRLCDLTLLALNAPQCDCSSDLSDAKLYKVQGFPTCFKPPLPTSLCGDNNVCGLAGCSPRTINKRVHSIKCDRKCNENQPFCEPCDKKSSLPRQIKSFWTDWSNPYCTDSSCVSQFDEAICINRDTGRGDIDCLGPGTSCCTSELQDCKCHVYEEGGTTKVFRTFSIPQPELTEYMSEEDFINSIPLKYLKEEFHKYPGFSSRTVRSNFGNALKETLANIYDSFPFKFGNTHRQRKALKKFKSAVLRPYTASRTDAETPTQLMSTRETSTSDFTSKATKLGHITVQSTHKPNNIGGLEKSIPPTSNIITSSLPTSSHKEHTEVVVSVNGEDGDYQQNTEAESKVSILHEVNNEPVDTFSTKQTSLDPGECEPCKRHLNIPRPHVNTNGIHRKSHIHEKPCKFQHNHYVAKRRRRKDLRPIYTRSGHRRYNPSNRYSYYKPSVHADANRPEDDEKNPFDIYDDDPNVLIRGTDNQTLDSKRSSYGTLRKKLSFDLIFDDTKIPTEEYFQHSRSHRKFLRVPVKRRYVASKFEEKAVYEQVTPKYAILLKKGESNTPLKELKDIGEDDAHIEKHFYARVPGRNRPVEDIPQFGCFSKTSPRPTTESRKQSLHSEIDDDDFITDESGMWVNDKNDEGYKSIKASKIPPHAIVTKTSSTGYNYMDKFKVHLKRADADQKPNMPFDQILQTGDESGECIFTTCPEGTTGTKVITDGHKVREDDEEDALDQEDRSDQRAERLNDNENEVKKRAKTQEKASEFERIYPDKEHLFSLGMYSKKEEDDLNLETTPAISPQRKRENPKNTNHDIFEDEDERSHSIITPSSMENQNSADQPDALEDEDLTHPAKNKKTETEVSTECLDSIESVEDFKETQIKLRRDVLPPAKLSGLSHLSLISQLSKRSDKVTSEEISDDDDEDSYADDDDVALEYDQDEKDEKVTTTQNMKERGEDKSVNAKVETEQVDALNRSGSNSSEAIQNQVANKSNGRRANYFKIFYIYIVLSKVVIYFYI